MRVHTQFNSKDMKPHACIAMKHLILLQSMSVWLIKQCIELKCSYQRDCCLAQVTQVRNTSALTSCKCFESCLEEVLIELIKITNNSCNYEH